MEKITLMTVLITILPALITGAIAYYFFQMHFKNEDNRRNYSLIKEGKKQTLPLRLQAYERITLFLERISPSNLLIRIKPVGDHKEHYSSLLLSTIEQEYEHNLSQQIYLSEECWSVIVSSKNSTAHLIKEAAKNESIKNANELREAVLKQLLNTTPPSAIAISFVKNEALKLM